jgi:plastocyanin
VFESSLTVAFVTVLVALLAGCSVGSAEHTSSGSAGPQTSSTARRTVYIRNHSGANEFAFEPHSITIRTGTRVTWVNRSAQPHTVTATGRHPAFDSGTSRLVEPKHNWSFLFRHAGRYSYYCLLHPYMTGVVIVRS